MNPKTKTTKWKKCDGTNSKTTLLTPSEQAARRVTPALSILFLKPHLHPPGAGSPQDLRPNQGGVGGLFPRAKFAHLEKEPQGATMSNWPRKTYFLNFSSPKNSLKSVFFFPKNAEKKNSPRHFVPVPLDAKSCYFQFINIWMRAPEQLKEKNKPFLKKW